MGLSDKLTCLLRKLYAGQEAAVRTMEQSIGSKLGIDYVKCYILSPCLFNICAKYIMRNVGLDDSQAGIKIARRNINNLRYTDDIILMVEREEELKNLMRSVKEKTEKFWFIFNMKKLRS